MRALPTIVVCMALITSCGDPGFDMHFANPCDQPVDFDYRVFEVGTDVEFEGLATILPVEPRATETLSELTIHVSPDGEIRVRVVGLPGYEDRWVEPETNDSRTFAFDASLCERIPESPDGS